MAGEGRHAELAASVAARGAPEALSVSDLHALCFAYGKTKQYGPLFNCLDILENKLRGRRDRATRLFALEDATPAVHLMRAEALIDLRQYERARQSARTALNWIGRNDDDVTPDIVIETHCIAGLAAMFSGDAQEARGQLAALDKLSLGLQHAEYANAKAFAIARLALALKDYGLVQQALARTGGLTELFDRLLHGASDRDWVWRELPRLFMASIVLTRTGRIDEAKNGFDRILAMPQSLQNGEIAWMTLAERGRIAETQGDAAGALEFYRRAIEVIEGQRSSLDTESAKIGFVADKLEPYQRAVQLLVAAGRVDEAFELSDRSKSRALVDLLAARDAFGGPLLAAAGPAAGNQLTALLRRKRDAELSLATPYGGAARSGTRASLSEINQQITALAPEVASLTSVVPTSAADVMMWLAPDEALLQYFQHGEALYAFVLTDKVQVFTLDGRGLDAEVRAFREALQKRQSAASRLAQSLSARLIAPVAAALTRSQLLIAPHGALHYLPFAALMDEGGKPLMERHALSVLPAAGVLRFARTGRRPIGRMALFGNPDLGNPALDLPGAEEEVRALQEMFEGATVHVRGEATPAAFRRDAPRAPYIHVAAHGEFDAERPLASRLLLAPQGDSDGMLRVGDFYDLSLDADLVVLSACETGLGKVLSGDEVVGLTRGLLFAGAKSVMASLWKIDDTATNLLMLRFYEHAKSMPLREALREAQKEVRRKYRHPYFWSAIQLVGRGS